MKKQVLTMLLVICVSGVALGTSHPRGAPNWDPLVWAHLVVEGQVLDVSEFETNLGDWGGASAQGPLDIPRRATRVRVRIDRILRGQFRGNMVTVTSLHEPPELFKPKAYVIFALFFNPTANHYLLRNTEGLVLLEGRRWIRQSDGTELSLESIHRRAHKMDLDNVAEQADLLVFGEIDAIRRNKRVENPNEGPAIVAEYDLKIEHVSKGEFSGDVITFTVPRMPLFPWMVPRLKTIAEGDQIFAALELRDFGYYPFAGYYGLLRLLGDGVQVDEAPYRLRRDDVQSAFGMKEVE